MRKLLCVVLGAMLCFGSADAQDLLRKLGKAVEKKVAEKVVDGVSKEVRKAVKNKPKSKQQPQKSVTDSVPSQTVAGENVYVAQQKPVVSDDGQNIPREEGLDYIDEYGINHGGGILIGGILWAPVNCGYHETDYPYGRLYQWGRKHGHGYGAPYERERDEVNPDKPAAEIVPAPVKPAEALKHPERFYARSDMAPFNWTENDMTLWCPLIFQGLASKHPKYDPCPEGWRVPELSDFHNLAEHYSDFVEYPEGGPKGRWFSGPEEYGTDVPRIFLPAAGMLNPGGASHSRDREAAYWSLRHGGGEGLVWHLYFNEGKTMVDPMAYPHEAYSVRCVKDIEGQELK